MTTNTKYVTLTEEYEEMQYEPDTHQESWGICFHDKFHLVLNTVVSGDLSACFYNEKSEFVIKDGILQ